MIIIVITRVSSGNVVIRGHSLQFESYHGYLNLWAAAHKYPTYGSSPIPHPWHQVSLTHIVVAHYTLIVILCGIVIISHKTYTPNNIGYLEGTLQYYYHATPGFSWGCMVIVLEGSF